MSVVVFFYMDLQSEIYFKLIVIRTVCVVVCGVVYMIVLII